MERRGLICSSKCSFLIRKSMRIRKGKKEKLYKHYSHPYSYGSLFEEYLKILIDCGVHLITIFCSRRKTRNHVLTDGVSIKSSRSWTSASPKAYSN